MATDEKTTPDHGSIGMPVTDELPGFTPEQMTACESCGRKNAPNRPRCMYCGAALSISYDRTVKVADRVLESWENGFNVVVTGGDAALNAVPAGLPLETDSLLLTLENGWRIPVRRVETVAEAEYLERRLNEAGVECRIVADEELLLSAPPIRIRGIDIADGVVYLRHFNTDETAAIHRDAIVTLIAGTIASSRTDTIEKRKRGASQILEETQASSHERVIDIYTGSDNIGFRIAMTGFDFSCLGADKVMLAAENMKRLIETLKDLIGTEKFNGDYDAMRQTLDRVWQPNVKCESRGMMRSGFGRKDLARTESVSNLEQFTRFSRLQRLLV